MAHNEILTVRVREALAHIKNLEEKRAFRGIIFMVNGKMCVSTGDNELMCRIDPAKHDQVMEMNGTREMIHSGKPIRGYVYVHEDAIRDKKDFDFWINLCLEWNQFAKASKTKASKKAKKAAPPKKKKAAKPVKSSKKAASVKARKPLKTTKKKKVSKTAKKATKTAKKSKKR
jgi:hypothetical protein